MTTSPEPKTNTNTDVVPVHQWTNGGREVLLLKCVPRDGIVRGVRSEWARADHGETYEFCWPLEIGAAVEAPDWDPRPKCGGGLHAWPWGLAMGAGTASNWDWAWVVFGALPNEVLDLGGKVKAHRGVIRFVGSWDKAAQYVLSGQMAWVAQASRGASSATGYRGAASATGYRGAASATGDRGAASATGSRGSASATGSYGSASATGDYGAASATGYRGAASATVPRGAASATGDYGAASATGSRGAASATGDYGAASATGSCSIAAVTGFYGRAKSGPHGCIALAFWNAFAWCAEMRCAQTGVEGGLKADTWYRLDELGNFVEDDHA
jgi:hypothetical protein